MKTRIKSAMRSETTAPAVDRVTSLLCRASSVTAAAPSPASTSNVPRIAFRQVVRAEGFVRDEGGGMRDEAGAEGDWSGFIGNQYSFSISHFSFLMLIFWK